MTYTPTGNPPGRPSLGFSRRKWAESVKALKALISNPKTTGDLKIRSIELLAMIYGIEAPTRNTDKIAIKELVRTRNFDRSVAETADRRIAEQNQEQESQRLTQAELEDQEQAAKLFAQALRHYGDD